MRFLSLGIILLIMLFSSQNTEAQIRSSGNVKLGSVLADENGNVSIRLKPLSDGTIPNWPNSSSICNNVKIAILDGNDLGRDIMMSTALTAIATNSEIVVRYAGGGFCFRARPNGPTFLQVISIKIVSD